MKLAIFDSSEDAGVYNATLSDLREPESLYSKKTSGVDDGTKVLLGSGIGGYRALISSHELGIPVIVKDPVMSHGGKSLSPALLANTIPKNVYVTKDAPDREKLINLLEPYSEVIIIDDDFVILDKNVIGRVLKYDKIV